MLPSLFEAAQEAAVQARTDVLAASPYDLSESPIIGIVSQPLPDSFKDDPRFEGKTTYMM